MIPRQQFHLAYSMLRRMSRGRRGALGSYDDFCKHAWNRGLSWSAIMAAMKAMGPRRDPLSTPGGRLAYEARVLRWLRRSDRADRWERKINWPSYEEGMRDKFWREFHHLALRAFERGQASQHEMGRAA